MKLPVHLLKEQANPKPSNMTLKDIGAAGLTMNTGWCTGLPMTILRLWVANCITNSQQ